MLDCLAAQRPALAADLVAQRIKALEVGLTDGNWRRGQHLELIEADGAPLVDKEEEYLMAKEEELSLRLQSPGAWYSGQYKGAGAKGGKDFAPRSWTKGKAKGQKGKGKPKGKGKGAPEAGAPGPDRGEG